MKFAFVSVLISTLTGICWLGSIAQANTGSDGHIDIACEPVELTNRVNSYTWKRRYNMTQTAAGFVTRLLHRSDQSFPQAVLGDVELFHKQPVARAYQHHIEIKATDSIVGFRKMLYTVMYNLYYGDTFTVHEFDPATGEYKKTQVGFHTASYFKAVNGGKIRAVDFPKHRLEKYSVIGTTLLRGVVDKSIVTFYNKEEMKKMFPQHAETIERINV